MSEKNGNLSLQPNPNLKHLLHALDPISLVLNQNSNSQQPFPLKLTSADSFVMERGKNYTAYAELRERRLRMRCLGKEKDEVFEVEAPKLVTPIRKQARFQGELGCGRKGSSLNVAQSVPDFSAVLRKENRKPLNMNLGSIMEMTPPASKSGFSNGVVSSSRGSKSESAGEKKKKRVVGAGGDGGGVLMARKSYASFDELRKFSSVTATAINGRRIGKTVSGLKF